MNAPVTELRSVPPRNESTPPPPEEPRSEDDDAMGNALDDLRDALLARKSLERIEAMLGGVLDVLGFNKDGDAQLGGMLANQAKFDYRIGQLEALIADHAEDLAVIRDDAANGLASVKADVTRIDAVVQEMRDQRRTLHRSQLLMTWLIIVWLAFSFYGSWKESQLDQARDRREQSSERGR